jgi:hypothetical protein
MRLASAFSCALIVTALGACGGSTKTSTAATTLAPAATTTVAGTAGAAGSTAPANGQDPNQAGAQGAQGGRNQNLTPEQTAKLQAYRDCLTANGVTLPQRGQRGQNPAGGSQAPVGGDQAAPADPNATPPSSGPRTSIDPAAITKAQDACKDKMPTDGTGNIFGGFGGNAAGGPGGGGAARATALVPYYSCLKDNGVKVADAPTGQPGQPAQGAAGAQPAQTTIAGQTPPPSGQGGQPGPGGQGGQGRGGRLTGVDQTTPEFIAANDKCKVLIPDNTGVPGAPGGAAATPPTSAA